MNRKNSATTNTDTAQSPKMVHSLTDDVNLLFPKLLDPFFKEIGTYIAAVNCFSICTILVMLIASGGDNRYITHIAAYSIFSTCVMIIMMLVIHYHIQCKMQIYYQSVTFSLTRIHNILDTVNYKLLSLRWH
jgi:hypothetical protein